MISKFNGTSTPKGSYSAKTGLNYQVTSSKKSSNKQSTRNVSIQHRMHWRDRPSVYVGRGVLLKRMALEALTYTKWKYVDKIKVNGSGIDLDEFRIRPSAYMKNCLQN